ncbi:MAG: transglycosylase domain-containing protein [Bacteroidetes bacterium]|nr:transglycosylase domain-containing protein [Bacteroidota bacterium]
MTFILYGLASVYLRYSAKEIVTKPTFTEIISQINAAPTLPKGLKDTYSQVYPDIFNTSFNEALLSSILNKQREPVPSRQLGSWFWMRVGGSENGLMRHLNFAGFIWSVEDNVTQEKCFEYYVSRFDFTNKAIGMYAASQKFYHKPLDSLTYDEQLGMILMLKNPAYYNKLRYPDRFQIGINKLKKQ